ncbi:MAG: hypothetical protein H7A36_06940 [Chlamydiales bacterium]|nr:hypothetical protein [Chlamydiales bacterium]
MKKWILAFLAAMTPLCANFNLRAGPGITPFIPLPSITLGADSITEHFDFGGTLQIATPPLFPVFYAGVRAVPLFRPSKGIYYGIGPGMGLATIIPTGTVEALIGYEGKKGSGWQLNIIEPLIFNHSFSGLLPIPGLSFTFNKSF